MGRTNPDGSPWTPGCNARLCSKHFISGKHSKYPFHKDYAPSIFPTSTDSRKRRHDGSQVQGNDSPPSNEEAFEREDPLEPDQPSPVSESTEYVSILRLP